MSDPDRSGRNRHLPSLMNLCRSSSLKLQLRHYPLLRPTAWSCRHSESLVIWTVCRQYRLVRFRSTRNYVALAAETQDRSQYCCVFCILPFGCPVYHHWSIQCNCVEHLYHWAQSISCIQSTLLLIRQELRTSRRPTFAGMRVLCRADCPAPMTRARRLSFNRLLKHEQNCASSCLQHNHWAAYVLLSLLVQLADRIASFRNGALPAGSGGYRRCSLKQRFRYRDCSP